MSAMIDVDDLITLEQARQIDQHEEAMNAEIESQQRIVFDKPNIFICGPSGSGKSTSLRNMNPETTVIINTERKQLPFKKARKFKKQVQINKLAQFDKALTKAFSVEGVDTIVVESFTSLAEMAYMEIVRPVERTGDKVMQAWQQYKDRMHDFLLRSKQADKYVVFLGIDEISQDEKQIMYRTVSVQGSLKGKVEKEFEIVLWTKILNGEEGMEYVFTTNSDGVNKAKSPMGMFTEQYIDNDLKAVLDSIYVYYTED